MKNKFNVWINYEELLMAENAGRETVDCTRSWDRVQLSILLDCYERKENRRKEIDYISKLKGLYIDKIIIRPTLLYTSEKRESLQDIFANPATIASFIITLAGIVLQFFSNFQYAVILVIIGILIFVFLVALKLMK